MNLGPFGAYIRRNQKKSPARKTKISREDLLNTYLRHAVLFLYNPMILLTYEEFYFVADSAMAPGGVVVYARGNNEDKLVALVKKETFTQFDEYRNETKEHHVG